MESPWKAGTLQDGLSNAVKILLVEGMFISDYLPNEKQLNHSVRNNFLSYLHTQIFLELCRDFKDFPHNEGEKEGYLT